MEQLDQIIATAEGFPPPTLPEGLAIGAFVCFLGIILTLLWFSDRINDGSYETLGDKVWPIIGLLSLIGGIVLTILAIIFHHC